MMSEREYTGRILALWACAFVAGVATYIDRTAFGVLAILVSTWLLLCNQGKKSKKWLVPLSFILLFAFGYMRICLLDNKILGVMHNLDGKAITANAIVERTTENGYLLKIVDSNVKVAGKAYLTCDEKLYPGDIVSVVGTCKFYGGAANPGEFSYMNYMKSCGNFFFVEGEAQQCQEEMAWHIQMWCRLCQITGRISSWARQLIDELYQQNSSVVKGMVLGDTEEMSDTEISLYRQAGIGHYFAVSGLHIGLLAGGIGWVFGSIGIGHKGKFVAIVISVVILLVLCGFTPSSLRATFMLGMSALAYLLYRRSDTVTAVVLSATLSLLFNPYLVYNSGFILSHGAIISFSIINSKIIVPFTRRMEERRQRMVNIFVAPVMFWIVAAPMSGAIFGSVATYGIISNLLCSGMLTLAFALALASIAIGGIWIYGGKVLAQMEICVISLVKSICQWIVDLPGSSISGFRASFLIYFLVLFPLVGLCLARFKERREGHRGNKGRWMIAFLVMPVLVCSFIATIRTWALPKMRATYLSVGQGDSAVCEFSNGAVMVVDGATEYYGQRLLDYLNYKNIKHVDAVVLSHGHTDHGGGIVKLMEMAETGEISIGKVYLSKVDSTSLANTVEKIACDNGIPVLRIGAGDNFKIAGNEVKVLWPVEEHISLLDENNYSLVLKLQVGQNSFIFTGDIESQVESFIIDYVGPCDVLKVAHHGSATSTQMEFLQVVMPKVALISVGNNTYGHPSQDTMERLTQRGSYIHVTLQSGALVVETNGHECKIINWKGLWGLRN